MFKRILLTGALALILGTTLHANADTVYQATLLGTNENPPNASTATGFATFTLSGNLLTINESFTGLTGVATGAHIHCCVGPGVNAPIAVPFPAFPATISGLFNSVFDLSLTSTYTSAFLTAQGGTAAGAQAALISALNSGNSYANIHDAAFPGGEIRGQIALVTPEPESLVLLGTGMIGIVQAIRKRTRV